MTMFVDMQYVMDIGLSLWFSYFLSLILAVQLTVELQEERNRQGGLGSSNSHHA